MSEREKENQKDDFWDLEALLPQARRQGARVSAKREDTETVQIEIKAPVCEKSGIRDAIFEEHFVPPHTKEGLKPPPPLYAYKPENTLLAEVRVYPWRTEYDYYENFRRHALHFLHREGTECPAVDFFSYMPQYTQLNNAQLAYYFWWRSELRRGHCLPAAFSYLLLYLYELINLGDAIPPAEGQALMLRVWVSYREQHPRLDALVREWLCDYSLLHRLPPPVLPRNAFRGMLSGSTLKEFYVPTQEGSSALTSAMLLFCNNYDYTKSKFFSEETAADYHRVLRGAVKVALVHLQASDKSPLRAKGTTTVTRNAFTGAICSYRQRKRIEVDYTSFAHTHELRYIMSDVLKYAENALRASRGIKSRLSIYALELSLRGELDAYLAVALPKKATRVAKKEAEMPDYERRYELPRVALSPERAAAIEEESWQTTKRLVEAFETPEEEEKPANGISFAEIVQETVSVSAPELPAAAEGGLAGALGELAAFLVLVDTGDATAQRRFAAERHMMLDAVIDKINTVAGDVLGDILIEELDGRPCIIEDYRDVLLEEGVL